MKKILFVALCSLITLGTTAQNFNLGVRGGINSSKTRMYDYSTSSHWGYTAGIFARINFNKLVYLEPAVELVSKQTLVMKSDRDTKLRNHSIDVPVLVGANVLSIPMFKWRIFAGPTVSYLYKDMIIYDGRIEKEFKADNLMFYGRFGTGVDFWNITLDVSHEVGLKKFSNDIRAPKAWNFTIGFKIF